MIIADTGLDDKGKKVVSDFIDDNPGLKIKVFSLEWTDDFSYARNETIRQATKDWILVIDADEVIDTAELTQVLDHAGSNPEVFGYKVVQKNYSNHRFADLIPRPFTIKSHDGEIHFKGHSPVKTTRIFKNDPRIYFQNPVHERVDESILAFNGKMISTDMALHHLKELKGTSFHRSAQDHYMDIYLNNLEKFTDQQKAHGDIGMAYYSAKKDPEKAMEYIQKAQDIAETHDRKLAPKVLHCLGACHLQLRRFTEAKDIFQQFIRENPSHPNVKEAKDALAFIDKKLQTDG
jgi:glycosyltransferase involved in cell wall biosynthesis